MFINALPSFRIAARSAQTSAASSSRTAAPRTVIPAYRAYSASQADPSDAAAKAEPANPVPPPKGGEAEKIAALEGKVKGLESDVLYHRAEIQTLTRRVIDERQKASEFAITSFARSLLSTSDVLTTALSHVPKPVEPKTPLGDLFNGVELTHKALLKTFEQNGIKRMEVARGSGFDPNLHEATFQIPREVAGEKAGGGSWGPGEIVEIGKEGWMIGPRVLRPAQVGVTQIE